VTPSTVTQPGADPDDFFAGVGDGLGAGPVTGDGADDGLAVTVGVGTGDGVPEASGAGPPPAAG